MNAKFTLAFVVITAVACNSGNEASNHADSTQQPASAQQPTPDTSAIKPSGIDYNLALEKLDADDPAQISKAIILFKENFRLSPSLQNDSALFSFIRFFRKAANNASERYDKFSGVNGIKAEGKDSAAFSSLALANGLRFASAEGMTFLKADYAFVEQQFREYVTLPVQQYLGLLARHHAKPLISDASLIIAPGEFTQRLMKWHNFNRENTDHVFVKDAKRIEKEMFTLYLRGVDNSPVYDDGSKSLTTYFKDAYASLEKTFGASEIAKQVKPYSALLKAGNESKAGELLEDYSAKGLIYSSLQFEDDK